MRKEILDPVWTLFPDNISGKLYFRIAPLYKLFELISQTFYYT
jgi:hypothetical protein